MKVTYETAVYAATATVPPFISAALLMRISTRFGEKKDAEGRNADAQQRAQFFQVETCFRTVFFAQEHRAAHDGSDRLRRKGAPRRARELHVHYVDEQPVQKDVRGKAAAHRKHRKSVVPEVARNGDKPLPEDLEKRTVQNDVRIFLRVFEHDAARAERTQQIRRREKQRGEQNDRRCKHGDIRLKNIPLFGAVVAPAAREGDADRPAHADAEPDRLHERRDGIGEVDRRKPVVKNLVADEQPVYDGKRTQHHARQQRGQHAPQKCFEK